MTHDSTIDVSYKTIDEIFDQLFVKRLVTYTSTTSVTDMTVKFNVELSASKFPIRPRPGIL